jgi:BON domain
MKRQPFVLAGLALCAGLFFVPAANAQLLTRWFGSRSVDKSPPAKSMQPDSRRVSEVNIEVAWLADPITFPYYLEAHATASQLEVRGYVPDKEVRDQAIRIAQVHSSVPVVDAMKEHPSLLVKTSQMSPKQLQSSVQSSLRVALPKQHQQLKAECSADGKVYVAGEVNSYDEKLAVSHALRRLHGCTSVQNLTTLPIELAQTTKTPIITTSNPTEKSWWPLHKAPATTKDEPPLLDSRKPEVKQPAPVEVKKPDGPALLPELPELKPPPKGEIPSPKTALTAGELKKRIQAVCPQVKSIEVKFTSAKDVTIALEIRTEAELTATFQRVAEMPELQNYRPEIQFKITTP